MHNLENLHGLMKLLVGHFGYLLFPKFVGELANHATIIKKRYTKHKVVVVALYMYLL